MHINTSVAAVAASLALVALGASACDTGTSDYKHASDKGTHSNKAAASSDKSKKAEPSMTTGQKAALQSAQSYLSMGSGFSRTGLIEQLSSKMGEGFKKPDAIWAVNHTDADWNAQAVESAKGYMKMGGFSKTSLVQQLDSKMGEGFTPAQAAFAAHKVGY
jgi:hypothetical protein